MRVLRITCPLPSSTTEAAITSRLDCACANGVTVHKSKMKNNIRANSISRVSFDQSKPEEQRLNSVTASYGLRPISRQFAFARQFDLYEAACRNWSAHLSSCPST